MMRKLPESFGPVVLLVDQASISAYADATLDYNPVHLDPAFAARTPFGQVIAHGTLSLNLIWQAIEAAAGWPDGHEFQLDVKFLLPVIVGDTVTARGSLIRGSGSDYSVSVTNQNGRTVIEGTASLHPVANIATPELRLREA
jgi:acyl dehydratase